MFRAMRFSRPVSVVASLLSLFCWPLYAQEPSAVSGPRAPAITAAAGETMRFSSLGNTAQIRVQILSASGEAVFDSAWKDGSVFDWPIESARRALASGSYRCIVMARDLDGQLTQKDATLNAERGQLSIEQRAGSDALTIIGSDESGPKITLLAHDGANGSIVSTSGDMIFRFGNFLAGKDNERMRLTAEGNVGIGTSKPQAQLDVNGLIRTSKGIVFPDGTILTTAPGVAAEGGKGDVIRQGPNAPIIGMIPNGPMVPIHRPALRANSAPGYQFIVDSAGAHFASDVILSSNLALPATSSASAGVITMGGAPFVHDFSGIGSTTNTFVGKQAGNFTNTGDSNTATGAYALNANTSGYENTANGRGALSSNTTGMFNTAVGSTALYLNTTGYQNTAVGQNALIFNTTGAANIGVGYRAGFNLTTGNNNIDIGNEGVAGESSTIRIGNAAAHTRTFIAGITGVTTAGGAIAVFVDGNGQLGTASSSRRYKFDIAAMGDATEGLMHLRPVTFRYLAQGDNAPLQYGLIAEEVAEVYPELVARNKNGEVETVLYQFLAPMLLNEVQKQQNTIEALEKRLAALEKELARRK